MNSPAALALVRERHARGWTQDAVAELCGCDRSLVSQWETGKVPLPEWALRRLADAGLRRPLEATVEACGGRIEWDEYPVPEDRCSQPCTARGLDAVQDATTYASEACTAESPTSPGGKALTRREAADLLELARHNAARWQQEVALLERHVRTADLRRVK